MLPDGTYDAVVVDAEVEGEAGSVALELTLLDGEHKGEVVRITAAGIDRDPLDLLAVPATLVVRDGEPRVHLEG
jgi:hypothetical protein